MKELIHLPKVIKKLEQNLEGYLGKLFPTRERTLPVKKMKRENNTIMTWNVYPNPPEKINKIFVDLEKIISRILKHPIDGELICYEIKAGQILDGGVNAFSILQGFNWDLYLYQPEIFIYIRLQHESDLDVTNEWISIDIDLVNNSAWFLD